MTDLKSETSLIAAIGKVEKIAGLEISGPVEQSANEKICDVCGRDCTSLKGINITLLDDKNEIKEISSIRNLFGKTEFSICFTCWLLSLGVRPKN